jgi:hypothetical protein
VLNDKACPTAARLRLPALPRGRAQPQGQHPARLPAGRNHRRPPPAGPGLPGHPRQPAGVVRQRQDLARRAGDQDLGRALPRGIPLPARCDGHPAHPCERRRRASRRQRSRCRRRRCCSWTSPGVVAHAFRRSRWTGRWHRGEESNLCRLRTAILPVFCRCSAWAKPSDPRNLARAGRRRGRLSAPGRRRATSAGVVIADYTKAASGTRSSDQVGWLEGAGLLTGRRCRRRSPAVSFCRVCPACARTRTSPAQISRTGLAPTTARATAGCCASRPTTTQTTSSAFTNHFQASPPRGGRDSAQAVTEGR